ncbi:hypothetical protein GCM10010106_00790 [Thermopolyspora flexuosa]|nr:hypothetical protein GCM10010106_00790 [Thermopolyspora flexuosa]
MPHCSAQYGQWVGVPGVVCDITGPVGLGEAIGMGPMVLIGGFTVGSLLLPLCYKAPTAFTPPFPRCERGPRCGSRAVRPPAWGRGRRRSGAAPARNGGWGAGRAPVGAGPGQTRAEARLGTNRTPTVRR